jgi:hypothetical protein
MVIERALAESRSHRHGDTQAKPVHAHAGKPHKHPLKPPSKKRRAT